jgi:hypothetical protein
MKNRYIGLLFLTLFCVMSPVSAALVTVPDMGNSTSVQGELNSIINSASLGDVIRLHDETTYTISGPINMRTGVDILGGNGTVIRARSYEDFNIKGCGMVYFSGVSDTGIANLIIDGGVNDRTKQHELGGEDFENAIIINDGSSDISIQDVYFTGLIGDGVRGGTSGSKRVMVSECVFNLVGHDGVQAWDGKDWDITGCKFDLFINSGVRIANGDAVIYNNEFTCTTNSGYAGVELEDNVEWTNIQNNTFHDINNAHGIGIVTVHANGAVNIAGNSFSNCPGGAMRLSGISVTNTENIISTDAHPELNGPDECGDSCADTNNENCSVNEPIKNDENCTKQYNKIQKSVLEELGRIIGISSAESQLDTNISTTLINAAVGDVLQAYELENGNDVEQKYALELLSQSEAKQRMAEELFAMGKKNLETSRNMVRVSLTTTIGINSTNENCTPDGCNS